MCGINGSTIITKQKSKYKVCMVATLLICIFHINDLCRYLSYKFQDVTVNGAEIPPHQKFIWPLHWHYLKQEIKRYDNGVASNGMTFTPHFMKIS